MAADLIADHLEREQALREGPYGCHKRRSCVDAVAILMNHTQDMWATKKMAGALFMDIKSAFKNVNKTYLGKCMQAPRIESDLIRWTGSFMSDRQVKLALDGKTGEAKPLDTGIPHGSPVAPILFTTYLSGIFDKVEAAVPGIQGLSFVDDISWWADGTDSTAVAAKLSVAAAASIEYAAKNGVEFDYGKTEAVLFYKKWSAPRATVAVSTNNSRSIRRRPGGWESGSMPSSP